MRLLGEQVWVRAHGLGAGEEVIFVHVDPRQGPVEVARHLRAVPGSPRIDDDHFGGPADKRPGQYTIRPRTAAEAAFLAIGDGAHVWLAEAPRPGPAGSGRRWRLRSRWPRSPGTVGSTGPSGMPR
jgi:hypothetical protein